MSLVPAILLTLLGMSLGALLGRRLFGAAEPGLRAELDAAQAELRTQASSQAQVMHTTKLASLGQMVAGVAHEINTPLGFVKSNVEVVGDLMDEHEQALAELTKAVDLVLATDREHLDAARHALSRARAALASGSLDDARELLTDSLEGIGSIANLVVNLKGFARVDRDGMDLIDLNDSVRSALTVAAHQMRDRVKVVTQLGELPKVRCMPSQLNQVFLNLVTNAAQAIAERGTITVITRATPDTVEVSIGDTGSGIPEDVLPRIFDPFFTTKAVGEGTGLGLSIVHKIIKAHGGTIHVKTATGRGTTFTIALPVAARPASPAPAPLAGKVAA
ncbi:MAG TPA: ATP-binding protein [Xanthomonadales bacterium]|nr:ATP-binding protein [Xanthomonadales bacterium]